MKAESRRPARCHAWFAIPCILLHAGCAERQVKDEITGLPPLDIPLEADNVRHDTLLIQATFSLGDGTWLMVASNRSETFEGLRLYRYRANPDSSAQVLAVSPPGYDSWTMLPTFFAPEGSATKWMLANFGERESWGQKLIKLDSSFHDLGFLDAAAAQWVEEDGKRVRKRRNIAPFARLELMGDSIWIRFACDSVYLYDDHAGHFDTTLPAKRLRYLHTAQEGLSLWLDDEKRLVKSPG